MSSSSLARRLADEYGTDSLRSRFARGAVWSFLGVGGTQLAALIAAVLAARILGRAQFGELAMISSTIGSFGTFAGLGIGLTATKYVAEFRSSDPSRAANIITISILMSAISAGLMSAGIAVGAERLSAGVLHAPALAPALRSGSILLILNTIVSTEAACLSGFEAFKSVARANLCQALLSIPSTIIGILLAGLQGAVWAAVGASAAGCILMSASLSHSLRSLKVRLNVQRALGEWRVLYTFSLPAFLSTIMVSPVLWLANTLITSRTDAYLELGVFNAANQWRTIALFLPTLLMQVTLPLLASSLGERSEKSNKNYHSTLEITQAATVIVVYPFATALMFSATYVMSLYGPSFAHGESVLAGVALTAMIIAVGACTGPAIQANGKMWLALAINGTWAALLLALVSLTARRHGALSLAYSGAAAYLITTAATFFWIRRSVSPKVLRRTWWLLGMALAMTATAMLVPQRLRLALAAPAVATTLWVLLWALLPPGTLLRFRRLLTTLS